MKIKNKVSLLIHNSLFMIHKSRGFTLIEILVAISIVGILSAFLLSNFVGVRERGRDTLRKSDLRQIQSALEFYRSDQGEYPDNLPSCGNSLQSGGIRYMQRTPCDPSNGNVYYYNDAVANTRYCLRACLENVNDADRDELPTRFGLNNINLSGCTTLPSDCPVSPLKKPSYSLQNP